MKTIYISGKISGLPMDEVRANFRKASEYILSLGQVVHRDMMLSISKAKQLLTDNTK